MTNESEENLEFPSTNTKLKSSKSKFYNNCDRNNIMKKLHRRVVSLEKELSKVKNMVGRKTINVFKTEKRMRSAVTSLTEVFQDMT